MQVTINDSPKGSVYSFTVTSPVTVFINMPNPPRRFCLYMVSDNSDVENNEYYFRYLGSPNMQFIKFNVPDDGTYFSYTPFTIVKTKAIETPDTYPVLPPAERNREKPVTLSVNPLLKGGTPARIFTTTGAIEVSPDFFAIPMPVRLFLLLHEKAHMFYVTEEYCDLMALVNFLRMGYNRSTAFYALTDYLKRSSQNIDRMKFLLNQIQKTQSEKL